MANAPRKHARPRVEKIGGEEFVDAEGSRKISLDEARKIYPGKELAPPTQPERVEAMKAIQVARNHMQAIFNKIGGKEGSSELGSARQRLREATFWANEHILKTKRAWR
jgi:hypothetical protein